MKKYILPALAVVFAACKSDTKPEVTVSGEQYGWDTLQPITQMIDSAVAPATTGKADLETFGDLKLGQNYMETMRLLGEPASRSKAAVWSSDGLLHENWDYKIKGIVVNMSAETTNPEITRSVFSIIARSPCTFKTSRNIGIGSGYAEVAAAYKGEIDPSPNDPTLIVAGSVYGGIIFSFENDKVKQIFYGAAAE